MENEFNIIKWEFERCSGYAGYRNTLTEEWIYLEEYDRRLTACLEHEISIMNRNGLIANHGVDVNNYKTESEMKLYWFNEFKPLFLDVMNLGMGLRQDQLSGHCDKSGNEVLNDWFVKEELKLK